MGKLKLLTKSIVFSTRSRRRFFTFVIIFSILSGATILLLNYFDNFSRQGLLFHKGVVIKTNIGSVTLAEAQTDLGVIDGERLPGSSAVIFYKYLNFGSNFRIFSVDTRYQWGFTEIKPNNLIVGSFPNSDNEVLVSEDVLVQLQDSQDSINIYTKPVVGTVLKFGDTIADDFDLKISGIFEKPTDVASDTREWILITEAAFFRLRNSENLGYTSASEVNVSSISIIASGDVYSGACYSNVDSIYSTLSFLNTDPDYNGVIHTSSALKEETRNMAFLSLVFGIVGTILVSTLYSYIITRFRRREVAVLKAMGYSKTDVRIVLLSEILVVAITGFAFGLLAIQGYLVLTKQGSWVFNILVSQTAFLSFIAVVLATIPGFLLISYRILSVRPIEIFRQK